MKKLIYLILILSTGSIICNNQKEIKSELESAIIDQNLDNVISILVKNPKKLFFENNKEKKHILELTSKIISKKYAQLEKIKNFLDEQILFNKPTSLSLPIPLIGSIKKQDITDIKIEISFWKKILFILLLMPINSENLIPANFSKL